MARFPAIAVVIALLSTPMALLVRGVACDPAACDCATMCPMQSSSGGHARDLCGAAKHATPMCAAHQARPGHHALDYGFIAPVAPTMLSAQVAATGLAVSGEFAAALAQTSVPGFDSTPFEPPRS